MFRATYMNLVTPMELVRRLLPVFKLFLMVLKQATLKLFLLIHILMEKMAIPLLVIQISKLNRIIWIGKQDNITAEVKCCL